MIIEDAFNSDKLIEFLETLNKDAGKKVFLILDNLRVQHSKPVKKWLEENKEKVEVLYLPSDSTELNPDEQLKAKQEHEIRSKAPVRTKAKLKMAASNYKSKLEQNPERVRLCFGDPRVAYATRFQESHK